MTTLITITYDAEHDTYYGVFYGVSDAGNARIGCGSCLFTLQNNSGQTLDVEVTPSNGASNCPTEVTGLPTMLDPDDGSTGYMYFGLSSDQSPVDIQVRQTGQSSYQSIETAVTNPGGVNQSFPVSVAHWCNSGYASIAGDTLEVGGSVILCSADSIRVKNTSASGGSDISGQLDGAGTTFGPASPGRDFHINGGNSSGLLSSAQSVSVLGGKGDPPTIDIFHADESAISVSYDGSGNAQPQPQLITPDGSGSITITNSSTDYLLGVYDESWDLQLLILEQGGTTPPDGFAESWSPTPATLSASSYQWLHLESYAPDAVADLKRRLATVYATGPEQIEGLEVIGDPVVVVKPTGCGD